MDEDDFECAECGYTGEPEYGEAGSDADAAGAVQCPQCGAWDFGD